LRNWRQLFERTVSSWFVAGLFLIRNPVHFPRLAFILGERLLKVHLNSGQRHAGCPLGYSVARKRELDSRG
jgi:hypothetical protein